MIPIKSGKLHAHAPAPSLGAHKPAHAPMASTKLPAAKHKATAAKHHPLLRAPEEEKEDRPAHKADEGHHLAPKTAPSGRGAQAARSAPAARPAPAARSAQQEAPSNAARAAQGVFHIPLTLTHP